MQYLRCCKLDQNGNSTGISRYPNLQQVFLTSRTYGGYANGTGSHGCLSPEPYSYELGFTVQRLIVAQINATPDTYSGYVDYNHAPWFDWGPYLWTSGATPRNSDQLVWCNGQGPPTQCNFAHDVRYGDPSDQTNDWGDFTHPAANGALKVANQLVTFFTQTVPNGGSPFVQHWNQW